MKRLFSIAAFGVALAVTSVPGFAQMSYAGKGEGTGTSATSAMQLGEGHMVLDISSQYDNISTEDEANPMSGSSGPCVGAVHIDQGAVGGGGFCAYTDSDEDLWVVRWSADGMDDRGALTGSWEIVSGTGKFDGASGGGSFSSLTDQQAGTFVNSITIDEISLP